MTFVLIKVMDDQKQEARKHVILTSVYGPCKNIKSLITYNKLTL